MIQVRGVEFILKSKKIDIELGRQQLLRNSSDEGQSGLYNLWYPSIRDTSTGSKFGAHGEHGDVFLFSNLGAL